MKIYNTLTRAKEEFRPLTPGEVRMYVCGVTVYDLSHIGHARSAIVFDVIRRYLLFRGHRVTFVKNFTDVDDKIIRRASQEGVAVTEISERYVDEYRKDMAAMGVLPPDVEPKATEHLGPMIAMIERLVAGGFAYVVDGDVYFEVRRFPAYGRLSGKNLDELLAGARVDVDERKRDPRDFALWKAAKPGEPSWPSPWGTGRPGWHIECSAMSMRYLGESFDIHGGGEDLIFPHHECEIAQSEACTGRPFARYWMHNGFVNLGREKMSKSLGNILTIKELVRRHDPDALRLFLLGAHYRHPVEWSEERVLDSARAHERFADVIADAERLAIGGRAVPDGVGPGPATLAGLRASLADAEALGGEVAGCVDRFVEAMDDDFNTPGALAAMFDLTRVLQPHRAVPAGDARSGARLVAGTRVLLALGAALGLLQPAARRSEPSAELRSRIEALLAERAEARRQRDWKRSDALRASLQELGVTIEDTPAGARWKWRG